MAVPPAVAVSKETILHAEITKVVDVVVPTVETPTAVVEEEDCRHHLMVVINSKTSPLDHHLDLAVLSQDRQDSDRTTQLR